MEGILHELNGVKYLMVEHLVTSYNSSKIEARCKKYEVIQQGISKIDGGGLFSNPYMVVKLLVPEKNIADWNNADDVKRTRDNTFRSKLRVLLGYD